jgi:hypothetical protein
LHFKNLFLEDLAVIRFLSESHMVEWAAHAIAEKDLKKRAEECDLVLNHDIPIDSIKNEIEFSRIIGILRGI